MSYRPTLARRTSERGRRVPLRPSLARRASVASVARRLSVLALVVIGGTALAGDPPGQKKSSSDAQSAEAARATEYLQSVIDSMRAQRDERDDKALRPRRAPLLKYSDPARGY